MNQSVRILALTLLWCVVTACDTPDGDAPPPPSPPPTTTVPPAPPPATTTAPEPPPAPTPRAYIQWSCHPSKPTCRDRFAWAGDVDSAYTVWRGERDLQALLDNGREYLAGGSRELVDLTPAELELVIAHMRATNERGDRLIYRIENEQHRDYDPDPLGDWHRSQVRKDVAREMVSDLSEQTEVYTDIAGAFPLVAGCDSIACRLELLQ